MTISTALKNVIVVGGSYVGQSAAQQIAAILPVTHRVLLIEPHSHFHFLFVFPRFAVVPGHEHKAFVPYSSTYRAPLPPVTIANPDPHKVVQARVLSVNKDHVVLDRQWQGTDRLPFDFVTIATGARHPAPGNLPEALDESKAAGVAYLQRLQNKVMGAKSIVIIGGGAFGVQMATDIKDLFPSKKVTVVQSRPHLMPQFDTRCHDIVVSRFNELGVEFITNTRVTIPEGGFPETGETFDVTLTDGRKIEADLVIQAAGAKPNNELLTFRLRSLPPSGPDSIINPANGYIRVKPTMQFADPSYPNFFAVGDIADTGTHKAALPGLAQGATVAKNIQSMLAGQRPTEIFKGSPAAIHLTLGLQKNIRFRNPGPGEQEPSVEWADDGVDHMRVETVWSLFGIPVNGAEDYHL